MFPIENLVGDLNDGWRIAHPTLGHERGSYTLRRREDYEVEFREAVPMRG